MVNYIAFSLLLLLSLPAQADSPSSENYITHSQSTKVLGTTFGADIAAGNLPATQNMAAVANVAVLGKNLPALSATTLPSSTIDGITYTEVYSFGKRVFTQALHVSSDGPNQVTVGLSPTEIRVPIIAYPVGPLLLEVSGGARFQANVNATLTPNLGIPLNTSTLGVTLSAIAQAAGFIEADLNILFLRGGAGGQVYLIDGNLDVNGRVSFDGSTPPIALASALVSFLNGNLYAFVDFTGFFGLGWTRLINDNLYSWNGYCFAAGSSVCPVK